MVGTKYNKVLLQATNKIQRRAKSTKEGASTQLSLHSELL
jgi:hypothetical protein